MRGLSFTPPWPFAIFRCGKNIENREKWDTPVYTACREYRGPLVIHASRLPTGVDSWWKHASQEQSYAPRLSQRIAIEDFLTTYEGCLIAAKAASIDIPEPPTLRELCGMTGHVVGTANVIGDVVSSPTGSGIVRIGTASRYTARPLTDHERRWWFGGFALVLDDVVELKEPIPCKGALGLWPVPEHVLHELRRAA